MQQTYGLVLAGGGAKGAYQIGAWRALRELGIEFNAIAGTSIGAINGALMAQGSFETAMRFWSNAEVSNGINLPFELKSGENLFSLSNMPQIFYEVLRNGGIDISPAKKIVEDNISEEAVRASNIPLAIVTFNLNNMKPVELFVSDMPEGTMIDYIMASARFPGLNKQGPDDAQYLDGGVYDNAPLGILRRHGYHRLIVIDISSRKGMAHKEDWSCANIVYIRPYVPEDLGAAFEFDKDMNERRMEMGYYDTKKAFGELFGKDYYFKKDEYQLLIGRYGYDTVDQFEDLARVLGVERVKLYEADEFVNILKTAYDKYVEMLREQEQQAAAEDQGRLPQLAQKVLGKFKRKDKIPSLYPLALRVLAPGSEAPQAEEPEDEEPEQDEESTEQT
ncbi:MAG: patatin-like phospholipase family protein [Clostridiaceae bacterium]|nr:patatin-like phospholipase family protein [Clostridiaceae bacterium]